MKLDICLQPAYRQVLELQEGVISSRELLERFIARIETIDKHVNAVVTRDFERARKSAEDADAAAAGGRRVGPLHGLPITIKDAIETAGLRSTAGAAELADHVPARDAPVVQALKQAGAYIVGKTNLPAWSKDLQTNNEIYGRTNNPWNADITPGGSSGGPAAAVATGMTAFDIGTDVGGSIRIPASFCGVFGHKPSFGIVPGTGYLDSANSLRPEIDSNVLGPIARSAEDLEMVFTAMVSGTRSQVASLDPATNDLSVLRVAAWLDDPGAPVDAEAHDVLVRSVDRLDARRDTTVDRSDRPSFDMRAASDLTRELLFGAHAGPEDSLTHGKWLEMNRERFRLQNAWSQFFERHDILLMPVCVVPPFAHLDDAPTMTTPLRVNDEPTDYFDALRWTTLVGQCYLPSTVAPVGLGKSGLPIGVQVVGRYGADRNTIRFAGFLNSLCGGFAPPPIALGPVSQ